MLLHKYDVLESWISKYCYFQLLILEAKLGSSLYKHSVIVMQRLVIFATLSVSDIVSYNGK